MKKIVEENEDYMFYIKLLPLKRHPVAVKKSKAIVCEKSVRLLERALDGKVLPEPTCETTEVDDNIELAEKLGISGTPMVILPDGGLLKGFRDAAQLMKEIETAGLLVEEKEREALAGKSPYGAEGSGSGAPGGVVPPETEAGARIEAPEEAESGAVAKPGRPF
jgi:thiol:disulfide interchange protein DsbC